MNIKEEVQLAIDMGIEEAIPFIYVAKLNFAISGCETGYYGYFNGKIVWLSRVVTGKRMEMFCSVDWWIKNKPNRHPQYFVALSEKNGNMLQEIWDTVKNLPYPDKYWTDEMFRNYYIRRGLKEQLEKYRVKMALNDKMSEYYLRLFEETRLELYKLNKKIAYAKKIEKIVSTGGTIDAQKYFDIPYLKTIPIENFVEINRIGFFKIRNEKTPSCKWYKEDNTWVDFGGDNQKHDVIDLVMILQGLDFPSACRSLSS